jgi:DNA-damage-inducible protein J
MKMSNSTLYQFRIDEKEKAETFEILAEMGIKPAQAVRLFFRQIRKTHALPFPIEYTPNEKTAKILLASDADKDYKRADSVDTLFADLKI